MGTTLTASTGSQINLINGANASNVFWRVGSSATLGTGSDFAGNIMALESITFDSGAALDGKALAYNGAVTMISNMVIPEPATSLMGGMVLLGLVARRRR